MVMRRDMGRSYVNYVASDNGINFLDSRRSEEAAEGGVDSVIVIRQPARFVEGGIKGMIGSDSTYIKRETTANLIQAREIAEKAVDVLNRYIFTLSILDGDSSALWRAADIFKNISTASAFLLEQKDSPGVGDALETLGLFAGQIDMLLIYAGTTSLCDYTAGLGLTLDSIAEGRASDPEKDRRGCQDCLALLRALKAAIVEELSIRASNPQ
jgi:hypothetical protein